jgi:hypothetical protein
VVFVARFVASWYARVENNWSMLLQPTTPRLKKKQAYGYRFSACSRSAIDCTRAVFPTPVRPWIRNTEVDGFNSSIQRMMSSVSFLRVPGEHLGGGSRAAESCRAPWEMKWFRVWMPRVQPQFLEGKWWISKLTAAHWIMIIPANMQEAPTVDSGILKFLDHSSFSMSYRVRRSRGSRELALSAHEYAADTSDKPCVRWGFALDLGARLQGCRVSTEKFERWGLASRLGSQAVTRTALVAGTSTPVLGFPCPPPIGLTQIQGMATDLAVFGVTLVLYCFDRRFPIVEKNCAEMADKFCFDLRRIIKNILFFNAMRYMNLRSKQYSTRILTLTYYWKFARFWNK